SQRAGRGDGAGERAKPRARHSSSPVLCRPGARVARRVIVTILAGLKNAESKRTRPTPSAPWAEGRVILDNAVPPPPPPPPPPHPAGRRARATSPQRGEVKLGAAVNGPADMPTRRR